MKFNYDENEMLMINFINDCRKEIKESIFSKDEEENEEIKKSKNAMIDIIFGHTMRLVKDVTKISKKMNLPIDFIKVAKTTGLLNDIAKFKQAVWSYSLNDNECIEFDGTNHGEYGYEMLFVKNGFTKFNIPEEYQYAISQAVRYHQSADLPDNMKYQFIARKQLNTDFLQGYASLNDNEKIIVSALVQVIRDANMIDNLYQHTTSEAFIIPESISYSFTNDSLSDISKRFGVSKSEIISYNNLESNDMSDIKEIEIPTKNMKVDRLSIPRDIKDRFFKNETLNLSELQNRRDYNFLVGMVWELNYFLNNLNFVSSLKLVEENKILDKIYNMYPEEYKNLVKDAFTFAEEKLVEEKIHENHDKRYIKRY